MQVFCEPKEYIVCYGPSSCKAELTRLSDFAMDENDCMRGEYNEALRKGNYKWGEVVYWRFHFWGAVMAKSPLEAIQILMEKVEEQRAADSKTGKSGGGFCG